MIESSGSAAKVLAKLIIPKNHASKMNVFTTANDQKVPRMYFL